MQHKSYNYQENTSVNSDECVVDVQMNGLKKSSSNDWNPNVPFIGTQEEWWEHFHQIEQGNFTPLEKANKEFELWKKEYLANRLN